jgi:hypothetical protein
MSKQCGTIQREMAVEWMRLADVVCKWSDIASGYRAKTTIGLRVPGVVETTVGANSSPVLIALCIASRNASFIFSCVARTRSSSIVNSSLIDSTPRPD